MCFFFPLVATRPGYSAPLDLAWTGRKLRWVVVSSSDHLSQSWLISPSLSRKLREKQSESGFISPSLLFQPPRQFLLCLVPLHRPSNTSCFPETQERALSLQRPGTLLLVCCLHNACFLCQALTNCGPTIQALPQLLDAPERYSRVPTTQAALPGQRYVPCHSRCCNALVDEARGTIGARPAFLQELQGDC